MLFITKSLNLQFKMRSFSTETVEFTDMYIVRLQKK